MTADPALKTPRPSNNFYLHPWVNAEAALRALRKMQGVDDEIELLRMQLKRWLTDNPNDLVMLLPVIKLIVHAVATRHKITGPARQALYENVAAVLASAGRDLLGDDDPSASQEATPAESPSV